MTEAEERREDGGRKGAIGRWRSGRPPAVPEAVARLLLTPSGAHDPSAPVADALLAEGRAALAAALEGEGERAGAFRLLAADAYATYACEAALESPDAAAQLRRVVRAIVAGAGG